MGIKKRHIKDAIEMVEVRGCKKARLGLHSLSELKKGSFSSKSVSSERLILESDFKYKLKHIWALALRDVSGARYLVFDGGSSGKSLKKISGCEAVKDSTMSQKKKSWKRTDRKVDENRYAQ